MKTWFTTTGRRALASTVAGLGLLAGTAHAQSITGYNVTNARPSGFGSWTYVYNGTNTDAGNGLRNLTGGGGSLNDGITDVSQNGNMLFQVSDNSVITLFLNANTQLASLTIFGGLWPAPNVTPGTLTGATISFAGQSAALLSTPSGGQCFSGLCNDTFNFAGTVFQGLVGNTIVISNFQGGNLFQNQRFVNAAEISVSAVSLTAVPEPETLGLMLAGGVMLMLVARRRRLA